MHEPSAPPDHRSKVAAALERVGSHRWVRLEVTEVAVEGGTVAIDLVIHYPRATPVCCGEPGCYLPFLGIARARLAEALGSALAIASPAVTIHAQLQHEQGYRYVDHGTGRLTDLGVDRVETYGPEHFVP